MKETKDIKDFEELRDFLIFESWVSWNHYFRTHYYMIFGKYLKTQEVLSTLTAKCPF